MSKKSNKRVTVAQLDMPKATIKLSKADKPFSKKELDNFDRDIDELDGPTAREMLKWVAHEANAVIFYYCISMNVRELPIG